MKKYNFKNMPTAMYEKIMQEQMDERRITQGKDEIESAWLPDEDEKSSLVSRYYDENPDCTCQLAFYNHSITPINDSGCSMHCSHRGSIGEWCRCGVYIG